VQRDIARGVSVYQGDIGPALLRYRKRPAQTGAAGAWDEWPTDRVVRDHAPCYLRIRINIS
jgi:hypothetical protein